MNTPLSARQIWRDLAPEQRERLRTAHADGETRSEDARTAMAYAGWLRRIAYQLLGLSLLFAIAGLTVAITVDSDGRHEVAALVGLGVPFALGLAGFFVGVRLLSQGAVLRAGNLAASLADAPAGAVAPLFVRWKYGRGTQTALTAAVCVVVGGLLWAQLASSHRGTAILGIIEVAALVLLRFTYNPWPLVSSYPHVATVDASGITLPPLGVTVPWQRVTTIWFDAAGMLVGVDRPDDLIAYTVSPRRRKVLLRWLRRNHNAVRLNHWMVRESPETIFLAVTRYRNHPAA